MAEKGAAKSEVAKREEEVLAFWNEHKIFEQSVEREPKHGEYTFYDGPPFATGEPHYGHFIGSFIKDAVPRYRTMKGYRVKRQWGWDCHGLPIENIVEKELGIKTKKEIIQMGVKKFNNHCRDRIFTFIDAWEQTIPRIGRWADMKGAYRTMDTSFMESDWWAFKTLYDKGLIYEDYRTMHICPRCETTLSQSEVAEGYKDVKDLAVTVEFPLPDEKVKTSILAWTTTPWTLPGNTALAVNKDINYVTVEKKDEGKGDAVRFILAKSRLNDVFGEEEYTIIDEYKGEKLVGKAYEPPFDYFIKNTALKNHENGWKVYAADFVNDESGTGIAHEAPAFGEDDLLLSQKYDLPFVQHVGMDGVFTKEVTDFPGLHVKPIDDIQATDVEIVKYLAHKGLLFAKEKYEHSYPHCWRCDTPLLNYATSSWFVAVTKIKDDLLKYAEGINWSPTHIKEGRWGQWLLGARDWSISRQRFWATTMPVWRCEQCKAEHVFGSIAELKEASGIEVSDLHKDVVDEVVFPCPACIGKQAGDAAASDARHGEAASGDVHGATAEDAAGPHNEAGEVSAHPLMRRISDVLDTWFDSGSVPYASLHYPFENEAEFKKRLPVDFIAEGQDQTRTWFYYQHVLAGALFGSNAFKNVVVNGTILAEDGKKMSKRLKNYPDPMEVVNRYGADATRLYMLSSPASAADNLSFSERGVDEWLKKVIQRLENVYSFLSLYEGDDRTAHDLSGHVLDRWIIARTRELVREVTEAMDAYALDKATRPFTQFVDDLSTWYLRRSRDRLKGEDAKGAADARATLRFVLRTAAQVIAPLAPFIADSLWLRMRIDSDAESVHLSDWPEAGSVDDDLIEQMALARRVVSAALEARDASGIKVRQPLAKLTIAQPLSKDLQQIVADEVNVEAVEVDDSFEENVLLDMVITLELLEKGRARELVRMIQDARKEQDFNIMSEGKVIVRGDAEWEAAVRNHGEAIKEATRTADLSFEEAEGLSVEVVQL